MKILSAVVLLFLFPSQGRSGIFTGYQLGIDYSTSIDEVRLNYDVDRFAQIPEGCKDNLERSGKMNCEVSMLGKGSNGFGIFIERAFKRQGDYYFDYDLGFGVRYLSGEMSNKYSRRNGLPLHQASFQMAAFLLKPYIKLGYTPSWWFPDLFLSLGPSLQVALGKISINDKSENVVVGTSSGRSLGGIVSGFVELEGVLWRFGTGYLSLFSSHDFSSGEDGTKIYPKSVDGMDNFKGRFTRSVGGIVLGFGIKLLTPWP